MLPSQQDNALCNKLAMAKIELVDANTMLGPDVTVELWEARRTTTDPLMPNEYNGML